MTILIKKSALASILIGLGVAVNFSLGSPVGPFLFAFGLLSVCLMDANLYTGKVGFWYKDKKVDTICILIWNCLFGVFCGTLLGIANSSLAEIAVVKIETWNFSGSFFIQAIFCGMIMYICVWLYKYKGNIVGILLGIPLFIFCEFQHSIANTIILGIYGADNIIKLSQIGLVLFAAAGNAIGAIIIDQLLKEK